MESTVDEFQIKRLGRDDIRVAKNLLALFHVAFEWAEPTTAGESYLARLLARSDFVVLAALRGDDVVGGLTAFELPMVYAEQAEMFIYDLAVTPEFQRQGVGKRLLSTLRDYCRQNGIGVIFVDASEEDEHALDFYRATGGSGEKVVQFSYAVASDQ